jgi:hypothetical protein
LINAPAESVQFCAEQEHDTTTSSRDFSANLGSHRSNQFYTKLQRSASRFGFLAVAMTRPDSQIILHRQASVSHSAQPLRHSWAARQVFVFAREFNY